MNKQNDTCLKIIVNGQLDNDVLDRVRSGLTNPNYEDNLTIRFAIPANNETVILPFFENGLLKIIKGDLRITAVSGISLTSRKSQIKNILSERKKALKQVTRARPKAKRRKKPASNHGAARKTFSR
jgi:hypothetical protein